MISVNSTYTNLIAAGASFEWRITNGSNTWTKENIMNGSIASTLFDGVSIGSTISSQLDIQLWNVTVDTSSPLVVQFKATNGSSSSSWYTKGTFYIDTLETSPYSEITKITAFDAMLKGETPYQVSGEWVDTTDLIVLNKIASDMGVSVDSATTTLFSDNPRTLSSAPNIGSDGTTEREMLSYIGALRGGNWIIDASNKLKLIILSTAPTNTATVGDAVVSFDAAPTETVKRVKVWINDDTYYAFPELPLQTHVPETIQTESNTDINVRAWQFPDEWDAIGGRVIDAQIPFFATYSDARTIYNQFKNKVYNPFEANHAFIQPEYEVGDGITIKDVTSIIASQTISISPLAPSDAELKKDEAINSLYPYKEPFKRKTDYQVAKNAQQIAQNTANIAENTEKINAVPSLVDQQTMLITGGFGGYIKYTYLGDGTPSEMLIMDSPNESTATNIIRLNRNGIGFSTDGGATYGTAWTIDGKFNADYIQAGTISDAAGKNTWNLTTGALSTKSLNSTETVYLNGGAGSYLNIPLDSSDPTNVYFRVQAPTGSENPIIIRYPAAAAVGVYETTEIGANLIKISTSFVDTSLTSSGLTFLNNATGYYRVYLDISDGLQIKTNTNSLLSSVTPTGITTTGNATIGGTLSVSGHDVLEIH